MTSEESLFGSYTQSVFTGPLVITSDNVVVVFQILAVQKFARNIRISAPHSLTRAVSMFPSELIHCAVDRGDCQMDFAASDRVVVNDPIPDLLPEPIVAFDSSLLPMGLSRG